MPNLDYIIILLFSIVVLFAGLSFRKRGSDMKSFFAAGGAVPWPINGLSLFMSFFSAGTFVVWGSIAYEYGLVSISIQLMMCLGGFFVGAIIAPRWRKTNVLTAAEFIRNRLGNRAQQFYTYLVLFISLAYTGAFLYPVAKLVNVSTGFSIEACVILLGVLIMVYTAVGGLWAVIVTDVLQFVILTAAVLIVVPLAIEKVGGLEHFISSAPKDFFDWTTTEYNHWFLLAFAIYNGIFIGGNWAYVQRYTSVKNVRSASKVGYLFTGLYLISPIIWMLPPMLYRIMNGDLVGGLDNEGAYLLVCKEVLPLGMLGLMLGGMIFATASSVNTTLNLSAAVFTNDIYKIFRPKASLKATMRVARISTLVFGIGTIMVALMVPSVGGIVEVVLSVGAVTGCSLYGPPIWALFSKRQTGRSILQVTIISLLINLAFKFVTPTMLDFSLNRGQEMLAGALIPFLLLALYEFVLSFKGSTSAQYDAYLKTQKTPTTSLGAEQTDGSEQNTFGLKVLSTTLLVIGAMIVVLGLYSNNAKMLVASIGGVILLLAVYLHPNIKIGQLVNK